ncbi:hypothetical protein [Rhodovulum sulfidophilum]|uniref:Uncharacterized protein n=1 Tax=Rhodovulum sulfidophilum TaxID=35806 RepID=A0A0D6B1J0_RHOSU|nr:hypothetical protein [Rhodovulum sulfidophilum]ANB34970.1 hypothetical protein A6W98_13375 [Rhodovulum sulfidophilum DSM 1374]ANB38792.1 hypothetical protein A6024_13240 [Rhodovulum sulfidophilum]MCE8458969.1 hypothetical protein [Rhodovulum sulfidophilum]MCE8469353.1 hypothetical protein [Rhodovulum sulfidophilum]MCW2302303.1 hypothetical protein [Rhodovulum sulfidophilum]
MNADPNRRGSAAVGFLDDLDPVEAGAVRCLRLWADGDDAQERLRSEFSDRLGPRQGSDAADSLHMICSLCAMYGRRPLMRHSASCPCLGADESCFATFVAAAGAGDREDAMLMATMLVRADMAPGLVDPAARLAMALRRLALAAVSARRAPDSAPNVRPSRRATLH